MTEFAAWAIKLLTTLCKGFFLITHPALACGIADCHVLQDNVALIVVLDATAGQGQDKSAEQPKRQLICVANTHIHANPELNDVKLWQVRLLALGKEYRSCLKDKA